MKLIITIIAIFTLGIAAQAQNWTTIGNSITDPNTDYFGTNTAQSLIIKTNNTEAMRILASNRNVGIGTATPGNKLEVSGGTLAGMRMSNIANALTIGTDGFGNIITSDIGVHAVGDIHYAMLLSDHDGWYLMDGTTYAAHALSSKAIANATAMGFGGNLPNAWDKYLSQAATGGLNSTSGNTNNQLLIPRNTLPNFELGLQTDGAQTDSTTYPQNGTAGNSQQGLIERSSGGNETITGLDFTPGEPNILSNIRHHHHSLTIDLNGASGQTSVSVLPGTLKMYAFVYLGL